MTYTAHVDYILIGLASLEADPRYQCKSEISTLMRHQNIWNKAWLHIIFHDNDQDDKEFSCLLHAFDHSKRGPTSRRHDSCMISIRDGRSCSSPNSHPDSSYVPLLDCHTDQFADNSSKPLRTGIPTSNFNKKVTSLSYVLSEDTWRSRMHVNCPLRVVQFSKTGMQTSRRLMFFVPHLRLLKPFCTSTSNIKQTTGTTTLRMVGILLTRSSTRALDGGRRRAGTMTWTSVKELKMTAQNLGSPRRRRTALSLLNHVEQSLNDSRLHPIQHLCRCHLQCQPIFS
jgi:hypothetical protein